MFVLLDYSYCIVRYNFIIMSAICQYINLPYSRFMGKEFVTSILSLQARTCKGSVEKLRDAKLMYKLIVFLCKLFQPAPHRYDRSFCHPHQRIMAKNPRKNAKIICINGLVFRRLKTETLLLFPAS